LLGETFHCAVGEPEIAATIVNRHHVTHSEAIHQLTGGVMGYRVTQADIIRRFVHHLRQVSHHDVKAF
jgi:hypothetical protein